MWITLGAQLSLKKAANIVRQSKATVPEKARATPPVVFELLDRGLLFYCESESAPTWAVTTESVGDAVTVPDARCSAGEDVQGPTVLAYYSNSLVNVIGTLNVTVQRRTTWQRYPTPVALEIGNNESPKQR